MARILLVCFVVVFSVTFVSGYTRNWRFITYDDNGNVESWPKIENSDNELESSQPGCSPWLGYCTKYEDCCRHLQCLFYAAKCVPKGGLIIPGQDVRPVGPGPYPPRLP